MMIQSAKIIKLHILFSLHIYIRCMFTYPRISLQNVAADCAYMILLFMLALAFAWLSLYLRSKLVTAFRKVAELLGLIRTLFICLFNFNTCILHETPNISPLAWSELCVHMLACIQQLYFAWDTQISSLAWCQPGVPYVKHDYLYKWEVCAFVHTEPSPLLGGLGGRRTLNPKSNL